MKYAVLFLCIISALLVTSLFSSDANASGNCAAPNFNVVDTPPPVRIAEPTHYASDTATGIRAERQVEIENGNPQEVVNPE